MAGVNPLSFRREELFSAFLDGELSAEEAEFVAELIENDREANDEFRGIQQVRRAVRMLPDLEIPAWLLPDGHLGDRLSAYLDGELSTAEQRQVSDHVVSCAQCRDELQELDRARTAVRSLPGMDTGQLDRIPTVPTSRRRRVALAGGVGIAAAVTLPIFLALAQSF
ncbi:MAG: zf-HC2 domain-containing protein [Pseudomonadota bacterium]|nr:zf-HC2 domain-containing protein [Pseudomonadota bacterium]